MHCNPLSALGCPTMTLFFGQLAPAATMAASGETKKRARTGKALRIRRYGLGGTFNTPAHTCPPVVGLSESS